MSEMLRATVLLGHGSRRGSDTETGLRRLRSEVQWLLGGNHPVVLAGLEFTRPSLSEALEELTTRGVSEVVVVPLFLFDGRHVLEEIPELVDAERLRWPGVRVVLAKTLGLDSRLIRLAVRRIEAAVTGRDCPRYPCECARGQLGSQFGVVVVSRGSRRQYDPGLRVRQIAALVGVEMGDCCPVFPAQAEYEEPTVRQAIDALALQGVGRIVVLPYLLFPGKVTEDNIMPAVLEARSRYPWLRVELAQTLGAAREVAEVACDRACEAWGRLSMGVVDGADRGR
jgi:sirohydrochlorin ferrochelatase